MNPNDTADYVTVNEPRLVIGADLPVVVTIDAR